MGEFANRAWVKMLAWRTAALILVLNFWLSTMSPARGSWHRRGGLRLITPMIAALIGLLGWITFFGGRALPIGIGRRVRSWRQIFPSRFIDAS